MEHEVFVPFPPAAVRAAFAELERVARCVPGLQLGPEARSAAADGRMRVRLGGATITYRGTLALTERGEGFAVEAEGGEARGSGTARLRLTIALRPAAADAAGGTGAAGEAAAPGTGASHGTVLAFSGSLEVRGRLAGFGEQQRANAGRRLLDRFTEALTRDLREAGEGEGSQPPGGIGAPDDNERVIPGIPAPEAPDSEPRPASGAADGEEAAGADSAGAETSSGAGPEAVPGVPGHRGETDLPPSAPPDPAAGGPGGEEGEDGAAGDAPRRDGKDTGGGLVGPVAADPAAPPPEADFARRTMIGRSAEEVDHAPPRGRYAPRPAPGQGPSPGSALRWAAPAAVVAVASAVVVRSVLRRRR